MQAKVHPDFQRQRLSPHFVYESYDEQTGLFFNRGSVGFVLIANPVVGASLQAQNEIAEFLKDEDNLPTGSSLQVLMIGSHQVEHFLANWHFHRQGEIFETLAKRRVEFLANKAKTEGTVKDVIILISVTIPAIKVDIEEMIRRRDLLKNTFQSIGLITQNVNSEELLKFVRFIFGWHDQQEYPAANPYEILAEQILKADFNCVAQEDMVQFGEGRAVITLEASKRPAKWRLAIMDLFLGNELRRDEYIKSDFLLHFGLQILPNQAVAKTAAMAKREAVAKNIAAGMGKFFPDLRQEAQDLEEVVASLQSEDRVVNIHLNAILIDFKQKVKNSAAGFCSMLRRSGFYFIPCHNDHLAVLLAAMPMQLVAMEQGLFGGKIVGIGVALSNLGRGIKTTSAEAKALLPIIGEWKGDLNSPAMLLTGRRGQIMYWSPFGGALLPHLEQIGSADPAENYNVCIAGVSGSGKSVFMQDLMWSVLGVGGKVFVLDYGRSFKRSCLILGGNYIEFDTKNPISINPFSEVPEGLDEKAAEARKDFLASFPLVLATMAAPQHGTNDLQQPMLQKALIAVWNTLGSRAEITDIADWLLAREESYAKELGNMLFPFTKDGQHGEFFSGKAALSLNSDVVVIETDHLRSVPELMTVIIQIMIVHINNNMAKGSRNRPSLIMIDEMTKTLKNKRAGEFVDEAGRTVRKYNAAIAVATQHLIDFFPKEGGSCEKIFINAAHKIILKQDPANLKAMRSIPQLEHFVDEEWKLKLMLGVHSVKNHYSEVAIYGANVQGIIGRLMIDPFNLLLFSTHAKDYQALEDLMAKGMTVTEAIEYVLKQRGVI